jgi:arsenate reductase (glutaredoxin)
MKIYTYSKCGTCRKAMKFLTEKKLSVEEIPIREIPPSNEDLECMLILYKGDIKRLFNTSGLDYRALNMKEILPTLSKEKAIGLLASNGNLVKRPFLLINKNEGCVGFNEIEWKRLLNV